MMQREFFLSVFLIRGCKVEVRVSVMWLDFCGAAQMLDRLIHIAQFVEYTTQIEMRDGIPWFELKRVAKGLLRILQFPKLIENASEVYMRFAPLRLHFDHLAVKPHRLVQAVAPRLTPYCIFEQFVSGPRLHLANFRAADRCVKWQ